MCEDFPLLARRAPFDIVLNLGSHIRPPEESFGFADRFVSSRVSGGVSIVDVCHEFSSEALVRLLRIHALTREL